jgi:hypothetical protein
MDSVRVASRWGAHGRFTFSDRASPSEGAGHRHGAVGAQQVVALRGQHATPVPRA